jgi:hypothetical protein
MSPVLSLNRWFADEIRARLTADAAKRTSLEVMSA